MHVDDDPVIEREIHTAAQELSREFDWAVPADEVQRTVLRSFDVLANSKIKAFVPVLARRQAKEELRSRIAASRGPRHTTPL
jgi:hypothetical protein